MEAFNELAKELWGSFFQSSKIFDKVNDAWSNTNFDGKCSYIEKWDSTDTKEQYETNGNKKYTKDCITYYINEWGYRIPTNEDLEDSRDIIACFGCSQTFGVGVKYEETWPFYLEQKLNKKYQTKNYGISGASADMIARNIHNYLLDHTPKAICCLLPDMYRRELYDSTFAEYPRNYIRSHDETEKNIIKFCKDYDMNVLDFRAYKRLSEEDNSAYNFVKNVKFIEAVTKASSVPVFLFTWDPYFLMMLYKGVFKSERFLTPTKQQYKTLENWEKLDKARDNIHLGAGANGIFADLFFQQFATL